ncbi:hypothetical protein MSAN_01737200 [Mycena sanguinolenta]|uniref:Uncharacterized protein n=1 Tax=Mycena sanguinolenta TaxID=230812 RepID=A0A8H6XZ79_9AGAR|nr:hypothetical protein MSAN_01737200 [Mycena sanguinolenta]
MTLTNTPPPELGAIDFAPYKKGRKSWKTDPREEAQREAQKCAMRKQNKRDQWKAASARYYERHPEVKEKKRVKMAEKRAAKKLARRQWDPPTKAQAQQLGKFPKDLDLDLSPDEHRAYLSHDEILEAYLAETNACEEPAHEGPPLSTSVPITIGTTIAATLPSIAEAPTVVEAPTQDTAAATTPLFPDVWGLLAPAYSRHVSTAIVLLNRLISFFYPSEED